MTSEQLVDEFLNFLDQTRKADWEELLKTRPPDAIEAMEGEVGEKIKYMLSEMFRLGFRRGSMAGAKLTQMVVDETEKSKRR